MAFSTTFHKTQVCNQKKLLLPLLLDHERANKEEQKEIERIKQYTTAFEIYLFRLPLPQVPPQK